jgi:hypothetical protein
MKLELSETKVEAAWNRSHGFCECDLPDCCHSARRHCRVLEQEHRSRADSKFGWEAIVSDRQTHGGCIIVCMQCLQCIQGGEPK